MKKPELAPAIARMQRQLIRVWLSQAEPTTDIANERLAAALAANDWELNLTAILAAARRRITDLAPSIKRVTLPRTSREGLDVEDRQILRALQKGALHLLAGQPVPPEATAPPAEAVDFQNHLLRCLAGEPVHWRDRIWWWVHTLTTPVRLSLPPAPLPDGIVAGPDGIFRLALTEIELAWVGPGPYWLGDERRDELRLVDEARGFFIARRPVAPDYSQPKKPVPVTWAEASELRRKISDIEQLPVEAPTADAWEMAARGSDGRRFPWANGYERDMLAQTSPCGAAHLVGMAAQWTRSSAAAQEVITCGHSDDLHVGLRRSLDTATGLAAFRPVICHSV